jgi:cytidylate kinase
VDELAAGRDAKIEDVEADLVRRDAVDSGRSLSPLIPADDAIHLDSTTLSISEVVEAIVKEFLVREARL